MVGIMLNKVLSWFKPKPCASCAAKSEQVEYLQKLIDQLLIKNGFQGLRHEAASIVESPSEKRKRESDEKLDKELSELEDVHVYGGEE